MRHQMQNLWAAAKQAWLGLSTKAKVAVFAAFAFFFGTIGRLNIENWAEDRGYDKLYRLELVVTLWSHITGPFGFGLVLGALIFAFWDPVARWLKPTRAKGPAEAPADTLLIDPFLAAGNRTYASVLIDTNNWRARILKRSNVFEVKASFIGSDRTAVQLVIIFDRWTFERGAVISTDNRLETYRTTEDAMTERYAIYSIHGIKPPCIIDIELQSAPAQPRESTESLETQRLAEHSANISTEAMLGAGQIEIVFDPADGRCVRDRGDGVTWYSVGVRNTTDNRTLHQVSVRALQGEFAERILAVTHGKISLYTGRPTEADPVLAEWPRLDPGTTEYFQLFATQYETPLSDHPEAFTLEARAIDTRRAVADFIYDASKVPELRRVS